MLILQASGFREVVDQRIINKIKSLVDEGVSSVTEMKRHLDYFVKNQIFRNGLVPSKTRRSFYPTRKDIANCMQRAKAAKQYSLIDQENVERLVQEWQLNNPDDKYFFRPYVRSGPERSDKESEEIPDGDEIKLDQGNDVQQPLLFCHQTKDQARLLLRYGNDMCLLDATYRTTKYALPLWFLCVRTNVSYQIVGSFVTQYESTNDLVEALSVFRDWSPEWQPENFMVDFSEVEINGLKTVFPGMYNVIATYNLLLINGIDYMRELIVNPLLL